MNADPLAELRVLFFAVLRDRAGTAEVSIPVQRDVGAVLDELARRYPAIAPLLPSTAVAVNRACVPRGHLLRAGDELALIPPVSGG